MPTEANNAVIDTLERGHILPAAQLAEVRRGLQGLPDPAALMQELVRRGWLTAYQAQQISNGRGAALVRDNYLLLEPIGAGGSGQVFKARHQKMGRLVALKILGPSRVKDNESVERFYREIEVASQLSHPNIVHAYEAGPIGPSLALVMEYVEGTDLEHLVQKSGPLAVPRACDYIRQVAVGLQYAHERGLVHRDIKPSNLLAKPGSGKTQLATVIKILDLGLARLQKPVQGNRTANLTVLAGNSVMQGTPDYMAPEQAIDFHKADSRADIYSLGCTFYYLLTGQPPFPGGTLAEKLLKHQTAQPRPIEEVRKDVPQAVAEVLRKMLAKEPENRYATAGDIVAALGPFSQPTTVTRAVPGESDSTLMDEPFPETGESEQPKRRASRRALWILLAVGGVGLFGILMALYFLGMNRGASGEASARTNSGASSERIAVDPSLAGHWRLDETAGTTAGDSSGKGNNGSLHPGADWTQGKFGGAMAADGQRGYMDYGTSPSFNFADKAPFTFVGWVNTRAGFGPILSQRSSTSGNPVIDIAVGFDGGAPAAGHLMALVRDDAHRDGDYGRVAGGAVNDGQWHQFALVRAGNTISLYLDGTLQGSATNAAVGGSITTNMRALGAELLWIKDNFGQPIHRYLRGSIDDVRIYHRALGAAEITALAKP